MSTNKRSLRRRRKYSKKMNRRKYSIKGKNQIHLFLQY